MSLPISVSLRLISKKFISIDFVLEMDRTIWYWNVFLVVGVAQVVEHRVVAPVVEGSNPFTHPILFLPRIFTETSQILKNQN